MATSGVMSAIQNFTAHTGGVVGVAAKTSGNRASVFCHNGDSVFFTASTLKVPLLVELYRQVDAGIIDVNQRIDLADALRVPGSGRPQGACIWASADGSRLGAAHDYHQR